MPHNLMIASQKIRQRADRQDSATSQKKVTQRCSRNMCSMTQFIIISNYIEKQGSTSLRKVRCTKQTNQETPLSQQRTLAVMIYSKLCIFSITLNAHPNNYVIYMCVIAIFGSVSCASINLEQKQIPAHKRRCSPSKCSQCVSANAACIDIRNCLTYIGFIVCSERRVSCTSVASCRSWASCMTSNTLVLGTIEMLLVYVVSEHSA